MELKRLLSYTRKAVDDYHLIDPGDKIAIGISGGKDSLTLLYALNGLRRFYPNPFEIIAVSVDLGFPIDLGPIRQLCEDLHVEYHVITTDIARIVFQERQEGNPCSLCAKMRKGALNESVKKLGCNKVAYAHHKDDVVETLLLSMIFEGRFHTFKPLTYLDRMQLHVIRPLLYVEEADIIGFKNKMDLPVVKNPCPADGYTKREYAKELLRSMNKDHPGTKERLFTAIENQLYRTNTLEN